uniref:BHLH domain-containing protein n=1 Tax=Bionectria ochroleuca TaxID=29856 RepID=A0A8H7N800_BIOOC
MLGGLSGLNVNGVCRNLGRSRTEFKPPDSSRPILCTWDHLVLEPYSAVLYNDNFRQQISAPSADGGLNADDKPRLTEEEKKQNHIASEQKRRQAIREGFDRLTELVPGLEGQGRSEGLVLKRTVEYMRDKIEERREMVDRIEQAGGEVDEKLKR